MKNKIYIVILIGVLIFITQQSANAQTQRAMWIWNSANQSTLIVDNYGTYRQDLFSFCKAPHGNPDNKISVIFLSCRQPVYDNSDNLRNFLSAAADSGMATEYLDGDPSWATYNQDVGYDRIRKVIAFNSKSTSDKQKFSGIHFDVEPYLLKSGSSYKAPYWDVNLTVVWESYVNYVDSCKAIIDSAGANLTFGIAIPRWYENYVGVSELKRLQSKADYVAIMDYNENASVIINDAANEINNAKELSTKVWIGVETKEVSPETVSFYEEGNAYMESQLASVYNVYGGESVFLGFAIHSYRYYKVLREDPVSVKKNEFPGYTDFVLNQNYPNPFNPSTNISFFLPKAGNVSLNIYNMLGQKEAVLLDGDLFSGWHEINFTNKNLSSGIYFYELKSGDYSSRKKMILLK